MVSVSTYRPPVIGTFRAIGRMIATSCASRIAGRSAGPGAGYGLETDPPAAVYAFEWIRSMREQRDVDQIPRQPIEPVLDRAVVDRDDPDRDRKSAALRRGSRQSSPGGRGRSRERGWSIPSMTRPDAVAEEPEQLVEGEGRQLDQLGALRWSDGHDRAPAIEWRLHELEVGVVGRGHEPHSRSPGGSCSGSRG